MFTLEHLAQFSSKTSIIWCDSDLSLKYFTYKDVISSSIKIENSLLAMNARNTKIGVLINHSPCLLTAMIAINNTASAFCCLRMNENESYIESCCKMINISHVITEENYQFSSVNFKKCIEVSVLKNYTIKIWQFESSEKSTKNLSSDNRDKSAEICYCCQTSGSCGEPKIIQVSYKCIKPNISRLEQIYGLTSSDVIYAISPPTFDPFVVDVFLALSVGAAVVMSSNTLSLNFHNQEFLRILFDETSKGCIGVTLMQTTPALFLRWHLNTIRSKIMSGGSSLRILVLGGEPFPSIKCIKEWQDWSTAKRKRLFNIYGITEVSCWSTILEIGDLPCDINKEIPLGTPIDEQTVLDVRHNGISITNGTGELFIGSKTRKCLINDEDQGIINSTDLLFRSTGDYVEIISTKNERKYFYRGRVNDTIKRYGNRVSLGKIERITLNHSDVTNAVCVNDKEKQRIILFFCTNSSSENVRKELLNQLKSQLLQHELPDKIIRVEEMILSSHGKTSKIKMLEWYKHHWENSEIENLKAPHMGELFLGFIKEACELYLDAAETLNKKISRSGDGNKKLKKIFSSSFLHLGGNSIKALGIVTNLEAVTKCTFPNLIPILLDPNKTLQDALLDLENSHPVIETCSITINLADSDKNLTTGLLWKINLTKCVDAPPTIIPRPNKSPIISVGSHSHRLINIDGENGKIIYETLLSDRIECQVTSYYENSPTDDKIYGFVGCYDGFLYCFEITSQKVLWHFNSNGMIKSRPIVIKNQIIFGNYNKIENVWCLDIETGIVKWSQIIGTRGIAANPCQLDTDRIVLCTLDGTLANLDINNGNVIWQMKYKTPIFSSPTIIGLTLFVAEVSGLVHCLDVRNDMIAEKWLYQVDGNIYSSFLILTNKTNSTDEKVHIIFGCHDNNLYCLELSSISLRDIQLKWKCHLQSQIYATPISCNWNNKILIICCTTSGYLDIVDYSQGTLVYRQKFPGEIYSSPLCDRNRIYFGCRDNHLYCIEITSIANNSDL